MDLHREDRLRITRLLDEMNVHEIDCGFASINQGHLDFLKTLKTEGLRTRRSAIARIDLPDYKKGIDRVPRNCLDKRVHLRIVFFGFNTLVSDHISDWVCT